MDIRILDLDGSLSEQHDLLARHQPQVGPAREWGPAIRLACGFGRFRRFEQHLRDVLGGPSDDRPGVTLYGSGDFHHVSLALLRRLRTPVNVLVLDNHPDWMRGLPFLHCGTWLYHAAQLPHVGKVIHVGGAVDFDNAFRWMAPWDLLHTGKITVVPSRRPFRCGRWAGVANEPLRARPDVPASPERIEEILQPFRHELAGRPLYVSVDKDVLVAQDAVVNWDSGYLGLAEVTTVLEIALGWARGRLVGADLVGDWSPVRMRGWLRHLLHLTEHPALDVAPAEAAVSNESANLALLDQLVDAAVVRTGRVAGRKAAA
jgi:hypothetical protein